MNKKLSLTVCSMAILIMITHANHAFAGQNTLMFYGKGVMEEGPLPGEIVRTLINGNKATIIHAGMSGIEVIRIDIRHSDTCVQTEATLCFEGTVTETKNIKTHKAGDEIGITLDLKNKKETVSFISGTISGASVAINLSKFIIHLDDPSIISLTQEGGIAGIQNEISIDTTTWEITQSGDTTKLDTISTNKISKLIKKLKFTNMDEQSYLPMEGSADYFTYSLKISQGVFQKTITWTDTSENVPKILFSIKDAIIDTVQNIDPEESIQVQIAKDFVVSSPTFTFDGMSETLTVHDEVILESFPEQHVITIGFTSLHGGYGDRTDQVVTQALTPHQIAVTIVEGKVVSAIIDGVWDELNQQMLES